MSTDLIVRTGMVTVGHPEDGLNEEIVLAAFIPRQDWMEMASQAIDYADKLYGMSEKVKNDLVAQAQRMSHFPLSTWIDPHRGCGCLVGEYLIAHDLATRDGESLDIEATLRKVHNEADSFGLTKVGIKIDQLVVDYLFEHGAIESGSPRPRVVVFED